MQVVQIRLDWNFGEEQASQGLKGSAIVRLLYDSRELPLTLSVFSI